MGWHQTEAAVLPDEVLRGFAGRYVMVHTNTKLCVRKKIVHAHIDILKFSLILTFEENEKMEIVIAGAVVFHLHENPADSDIHRICTGKKNVYVFVLYFPDDIKDPASNG